MLTYNSFRPEVAKSYVGRQNLVYLNNFHKSEKVGELDVKRYMKLPKLGYIKTSKTSRLTDCKIKRYTLSRDTTGRYYLSLQVECENQALLPKTNKSVGLDLGVADLAISSDGIKYDTFHVEDLEYKAELWQRKFSKRRHQAKVCIESDKYSKVLVPRDFNDFKNLQKAQQRKARLQAKIANKRKDYLHKLTTALVNQYDTIVIEDLKLMIFL